MSDEICALESVSLYETEEDLPFEEIHKLDLGLSIYPKKAEHKWAVLSIANRYGEKLFESKALQLRNSPGATVVAVPYLPAGTLRMHNGSRWKNAVYIGISQDEWNAADWSGQHDMTVNAITRCIEHLCERDSASPQPAHDVANELLRVRDEMEIVRLRKDTKSYSVVVSYQIHPQGQQSRALIEYINHKTDFRRKDVWIELGHHDDVFKLCSSVSVSGDKIKIKPRSGVAGQTYRDAYKCDFELPLEGPWRVGREKRK